MSVTIIKQGLACSIQDEGRYGYQHLGINPTGAMDNVAAATANILTGNNTTQAVVEMHFPAPAFLFNQTTLIALTGANFNACVNDIAIPINTPIVIKKGCLLHFNKKLYGERCYLAVYKGFAIEKWLSSYSTNIAANAGGYKGRYLQKGDEIHFNATTNFSSIRYNADATILSWKIDTESLYGNNHINITKGNEFNLLDDASKKLFQSQLFTITPQSNNMGYRIKGELLHLSQNTELLSTAVTKGTIQLLHNGQLIILMAAHQTMGGYSRIGHITSASFSTFAQLPFNSNIYFNIIEQGEAENVLIKQQAYLQQLQTTCNFQLHEYFNQNNLH